MANITVLGSLSRLTASNKVFIVKDTDTENIYFCNDVEAFKAAPSSAWRWQRILRIISRTFFYPNGAMELYSYTEEEKALLATLNSENDPKLTQLVKMCEGADDSDIEKFLECTRVEIMEELQDLGSNLSFGLGFPGKGLALIVADFNEQSFRRGRRIFLQVVHSYMEGYSVEHQELTPELFDFAHLPEIKELYARK